MTQFVKLKRGYWDLDKWDWFAFDDEENILKFTILNHESNHTISFSKEEYIKAKIKILDKLSNAGSLLHEDKEEELGE